jgi:hypothetical protein
VYTEGTYDGSCKERKTDERVGIGSLGSEESFLHSGGEFAVRDIGDVLLGPLIYQRQAWQKLRRID